jgi:hypothetical protein
VLDFNDKLSTNNQELICPPFALVILQTSSHWHDNPPYCGLWNVVPSPVRLVEVLPEWMCICWSVLDTAAQFSFAFQQYYARQQTACYLHVLHFVTAEYWCHACNCQTWMSSNIIVLNWAAVSDTDQQIHIHSGRTSTSLTGDGTTFHNPQYGECS